MIFRNVLTSLFFIVATFTIEAQTVKKQAVIFDSDMGPDYDDVGAIALLHAFADSGKIKILATMASTNYEGVAGVLNVFNTYFKKPNIPIGIPKKNALGLKDWQHWTDTLLSKYPHTLKTNQEAEDATTLYRKILAAQADHSVVIITVGFFTNLSNLLQSSPDGYSKLSGKKLVEQKVKRLVSMAGKFPTGNEFNVEKDTKSSQYVLAHWKTPIIFSGFDIGEKIHTGLPITRNSSIINSPVKDVFRICIPMDRADSLGRMSWDETAVLVAAMGTSPYYRLEQGSLSVDDNGKNRWVPSKKKQYTLVENADYLLVKNYINELMQHQPK